MGQNRVVLTYYHSLNHKDFMNRFNIEADFKKSWGISEGDMYSDSHLVVDSNRPGLKALWSRVKQCVIKGDNVLLICYRLTDLCITNNYAEWIGLLQQLYKAGVQVADFQSKQIILDLRSKSNSVSLIEEFLTYQSRPVARDNKKDVKRAVFNDHVAGLSYAKLAKKYGFSSRTAINYVQEVRKNPNKFSISV